MLAEQFHTLYKGVTITCSPTSFVRNVKLLQRKYGQSRSQAMATAYAILAWSCERTASDVRAQLQKEVAERFLTKDELAEAALLLREMSKSEGGMDNDALKELSEIDAILGKKKTLVEQRPAVTDVVARVEDDLKKGVLVSLARMMREMGYDRWPRDPEGQEDIKRVIESVSRELVKMGRRFNTLLRDQLRVLKARGPAAFEKIIRRWLAGQPEEGEPSEQFERPGPEGPEKEKARARGEYEIEDDDKEMKEQIAPETVDEKWWDNATEAYRMAALTDIAGLDRTTSVPFSKMAWAKLPKDVAKSLMSGEPLEVGWEE